MTHVERLAEDLLRLLETKRLKLAVAESCTAGLLSFKLSDAPGASTYFSDQFFLVTDYGSLITFLSGPGRRRGRWPACGSSLRQ
jgi:hypothetical protein